MLRLKFEPRDLWVGVHWNYSTKMACYGIDVYICLVPMFPIYWRIDREHFFPRRRTAD